MIISIRRRAQEAREALSLGLQRVQMIQEEAQSVPQLQARITQLEAELQQYRCKHLCSTLGRMEGKGGLCIHLPIICLCALLI